ncbi:MAG: hypothetical protein HY000_32495 [Planctomycetes bacterium]|nr:hypothetical protein [Planctomycetota bacterium]
MTDALTIHDLQRQMYLRSLHESRVQRINEWLAHPTNMVAAWHRVQASRGAHTPGIDGETVTPSARSPRPWLTELARQLAAGTWQPTAPRWLEIPKAGGQGTRRLGIPTLRDRVVHTALKQLLEPVLDPRFFPHSVGFRPGTSVAWVLDQALNCLSGGTANGPRYSSVLRLDIANCFDEIDHGTLLDQLARHVADARILDLIRMIVVASGTTVGRWWWSRTRGLLQGSALSPLLCNLYLHGLDVELVQWGTAHHEQTTHYRYADDLLVLAADDSLAGCTWRGIGRELQQLRQRLHPTKCHQRLASEGFEWLGVWIHPRLTAAAKRPCGFGFDVPTAKIEAISDEIERIVARFRRRRSLRVQHVEACIRLLNQQMKSARQTYRLADNLANLDRSLDAVAQDQIGRLLRATGVARAELSRRYRIRLPGGIATWQVGSNQLVVLSSLTTDQRRPIRFNAPWLLPPPSASQKAPFRAS